MRRKILSILMSFVMVFSLITMPTFADEVNVNDDVNITKIVEQNINTDEVNKKSNNSYETTNEIVQNDIDKATLSESNEKDGDETKKESENTINNPPVNYSEIEIQAETQFDSQNDLSDNKQSNDDFNSTERKKWFKSLEEKGINKTGNTISQDIHSIKDGNQKIYLSDEDSNISVTTPPMVMFRSAPNQKSMVKKRFTVLVLDISGSMEGKPIENVKKATKKFCEAMLNDNAQNYVAIVPYSNNVKEDLVVKFSRDKKSILRGIDNLSEGGGTNTNEGLEYAGKLLSAISNEKDTVKNIVLFSDGFPNKGKTLETGKYTIDDDYDYKYENACYETAKSLKEEGYKIYTLGFFQNLDDLAAANEFNPEFPRRFMNDLQNSGYYDVTDADNIEFVFDELTADIIEKIGTFKYPGTTDGIDHESTYVYKDSYFKDSSYNYNQHLATMSLCLELSSWCSSSESEYGNKSINARNLLSEIGFSDFWQNSMYYSKPTMDSIGAIAANKKIIVNGQEYTLIALVIRGGGYESEWASNFTIGMTGYHQGFREARDNVEKFLQKYVNDLRIDGHIKLWITGYSRAGATANLVAGAINEKNIVLSSCRLKPEDMYVYTFEAPQGAPKDVAFKRIRYKEYTNIHNNIHNIVNLDDAVPYVAPDCWNFRRYGIDKILPHKSLIDPKYSSKFEKMKNRLDEYSSFPSSNYKIDKFRMKKIVPIIKGKLVTPVDDKKNPTRQNKYLRSYINMFAGEFIEYRASYVMVYQEGIRHFMKLIFSSGSTKSEKFFKIFFKKMQEENWLSVIFNNDFLESAESREKRVYENTAKLVVESLEEAGITDYDADTLKKACVCLGDLMVSFVASHPNLAATFYCNSEGIAQAHYPEICLAWMQSMDDNYEPGATPIFTYGKNRIIRINCPVDVYIYERGELAGKIENNEVYNLYEYGSSFGINEDGEKIAYLTAECDCSVKIVATGDGTVNCSIQEESINDGTSRLINYFDMPVKKGTVLTADLPEYSKDELEDIQCNPSSRNYTLKNETENKNIPPTNELFGQDAKNSTCYIDVKVDEVQRYGLAWGAGTRVLGGYAIVTAYPADGYHLEGWYEDDKKISSELEYRLRADKDRTLIAKFEKDDEKNKNDTETNNKKSDNKAQDKDKNNYENKADSNKKTSESVQKQQDDKKNSQSSKNSNKIQNNKSFSDDENQNNFKEKSSFTDIDNHPAKESIIYLCNKGIISGYPDNTFRPNDSITRSEAVKIILNAKNLSPNKYKNIFTDVQSDDWFADYLQTTMDYGIIYGYPDKSFHPNEDITLAQWTIILDSLDRDGTISEKEAEQILSQFNGKDAIPSWSRLSIARLLQSGIISSNDIINTNKPISRAEIANTLFKLLNQK